MMANTNAVTLPVTLLLSLLFLLSNAVDVDPTSITATQVKGEITAVDSGSNAVVSTTSSSEEGKTEDRIVFRPAVDSISAIDPDLIAHSFRIPFHRHAGRPRCRRGSAEGFLRLPSGHAHRHVHHGEGFGFDHKRMQEKNEIEEKEVVGDEESKKEFDEGEFQHKRKKIMRKMGREDKDDENDKDDDEKMEEFEHKRKKMMKRMRFNNGEAEEFEHEHRHKHEHGHKHEHEHEKEHKHEHEDKEEGDEDEKEEGKKFGHKRMRRFRNEREEGGSMDRVHHLFEGFF